MIIQQWKKQAETHKIKARNECTLFKIVLRDMKELALDILLDLKIVIEPP